ncbi:MAG: hypothetical protein ACRDP4_01345, partial [Nocardioidaceae bacterium]
STIVLSARGGEAGPSSCCSCPHINFHTHPDHARAYLADHPALAGPMLDQDTAVDLAGATFGPLLGGNGSLHSQRADHRPG